MVEGLRLGFGGRRSCYSCLDLGGGGSAGEEMDFLGDSATQVIEGLADVWRVVVRFIGVLGSASMFRGGSCTGVGRRDERDLQELLMNQL